MNRRANILTAFAVLVFAGALGWSMNSFGDVKILAALVGVALLIFTLRASDSVLPVIVLLTLAMGSSYRWDISQQSFYLRFILLGLINIRCVFYFFSLRARHEGTTVNHITLIHGLLLWVIGFGILSTFYAVDPSLTFQRALSFAMFYVVIFVYFWLRASSLSNVETLFASVWWSALILISMGFVVFFKSRGEMFVQGRLRLILGNPNQLGHFSAFCFPVAIWFLMEKASGWKKKVAWVLLALLGVCLIWSGSRAALVASFTAGLIQFGLCYRKHLSILIFVLCLAGAIQLLLKDPEKIPEREASFFKERVLREQELQTGSGRTEVWKAAIRLIDQRPLMGYGFGMVETLFQKGYFPFIARFQGGHVHNSYLEELLNLGWLGAWAIFGSVAYVLVFGAFSLFHASSVTESFRLACALYGVVVVGIISGTFESWFTSVGSVLCFPFWFMASLFLKVTLSFRDW